MIKVFLWSFFEQGGSKLVGMVIQIVLARLLAPEAFGLLAVLLVVTNIADSVAQSGFGMALIQKTRVDDSSYDTAFWLSLGLAAALYVLIFLFAPTLADFYGMPDLNGNLRVLALVIFFNSANSIQRSYMQRQLDFKGLFRVSFAAVVASGAVGIVAAFMDWGIWALVAQALSQSVFTCLAMALFVPWRPHLRFSCSEARALYGYGWKICVTGILGTLYTGVSELVLGKACNAEALGFYSQGRKYPNAAIGIIEKALANVFFPLFAKVKNDASKLRSVMNQSLTIGTFIVAPISLLAAASAESVVGILLGEQWLPCISIFALICAGNAISMLQLVNLRAYMALGRSDLYMWLQLIKVCIGIIIIGGTAFVTHDIYTTAWATFGVGIFNFIVIDMAPAERVHGYSRKQQLCDVASTLAAAVLAYATAMAVTLLGLGYAMELLLQCVVYVATYLALAKAMRIPALEGVFSLMKEFSSRKR